MMRFNLFCVINRYFLVSPQPTFIQPYNNIHAVQFDLNTCSCAYSDGSL